MFIDVDHPQCGAYYWLFLPFSFFFFPLGFFFFFLFAYIVRIALQTAVAIRRRSYVEVVALYYQNLKRTTKTKQNENTCLNLRTRSESGRTSTLNDPGLHKLLL